MVRAHPPQAVLVDYALGNLSEPAALLVASHLTFCPLCRDRVMLEETVGGIMLDGAGQAGDAATEIGLEAVLSRLDAADDCEPPVAASEPNDPLLPRPLARYLGGGLDRVRWRTILPGFGEAMLVRAGRASARLIRTRSGKGVATHTHEGMELTLVLAGALSDGGGHYERGDVTVADGSVHHAPKAAGDEDCICLIVTEAPLRFEGRWGPVLNFLTR